MFLPSFWHLATWAWLPILTKAKLPDTYKYGTNIGGWLVNECWMNPVEWIEMGGEYCPEDFSSCVSTEWGLTRRLGQERANEVFQKHWQSWFTEDYIFQLKGLGLDHVRIVLGFWIIEELVESPAERYPQGGWMELKRGLRQLRDAGFHASLDMHAMPGVAASKQVFAGNYTSDMQFYTDHNYQRALTWSAILTSMSHLDPDFESVVAVQCMNEPHYDVSLTPGLEQYYSDFVTITRVIEYAMGVECEADLRGSVDRLSKSQNAILALRAAIPLIPIYATKADVEVDPRLTERLKKWASSQPSDSSTDAKSARPSTVSRDTNHRFRKHPSFLLNPTQAALAPIRRRSTGRFLVALNGNSERKRSNQSRPKACITTMVMSKRWQHKGDGASMVKHTLGPAAYDDHAYFAFGGVADPDFKSYMTKICNVKYYRNAKLAGEVPFGHGEFSLATNFNASSDELRAWGDAQRFMFNQEHYWTFWNFRLGPTIGPTFNPRSLDTWSYLGAVEADLWPRDPKNYYNPNVCEPYQEKPDQNEKNRNSVVAS